MIDILILEDEGKTARELKGMAEALCSDCRVVAIIPSVKAALEWFSLHTMPHLILSDIQLADGLSFDIFKSVRVQAPIIFCTAYDEYAIRSFEANGIDYLLKPIEEKKLKQSFDKYIQLRDFLSARTPGLSTKLERLVEQLSAPYKKSLLVHFQDKIIPLKTSEIRFIHSASGVVSVFTHQNRSYYLDHTLEALERMLDPDLFFKANRQFIVHREAIQTAEHFFTRRLVVKLVCPTPEPVIISKVRVPEFLRWMEGQ